MTHQIPYHPPETPKVTLPSVQNSPDVQQEPKNNLLIQIHSSVMEFDHWEHFPADTQLIRLHTICRLTSPSLTTQV